MIRNTTLRHTFYCCLCIFFANLFFSLPLKAAANDAGVTIRWGYKGNLGPSRWGQLDPHFMLCAVGQSQSPINIGTKYKRTTYKLKIHYKTAPLILMEDGETELAIGSEQTLVNTGHGLQINFHNNQVAEIITYNAIQYQLKQFHFHSPSETLWHGQSFPLEIHFVHQGEAGKVLVIGVFVKAGKENPMIDKIIHHLPSEEGKEEVVLSEKINPVDLLPANKAYYSFMGSLTTPPCTENIQWLVMPNAITASPAQIASLRNAMGGANARPVQSLNRRTIYFADNPSEKKS